MAAPPEAELEASSRHRLVYVSELRSIVELIQDVKQLRRLLRCCGLPLGKDSPWKEVTLAFGVRRCRLALRVEGGVPTLAILREEVPGRERERLSFETQCRGSMPWGALRYTCCRVCRDGAECAHVPSSRWSVLALCGPRVHHIPYWKTVTKASRAADGYKNLFAHQELNRAFQPSDARPMRRAALALVECCESLSREGGKLLLVTQYRPLRLPL